MKAKKRKIEVKEFSSLTDCHRHSFTSDFSSPFSPFLAIITTGLMTLVASVRGLLMCSQNVSFEIHNRQARMCVRH